jgi:hypothetical protein
MSRIAIFSLEPVSADNVVAIVIGIVGFGGTILGLYFAYRQLVAARRASQGQFLLQLADHFRHFDEIHRSLLEAERPEPWRPPRDDWVSVVQYMGLFERCKVLVDCDVLNLSEFERQYGYRFRHLVGKQSVRDRYFADAETAEGWEDFRKIWAELDVAYEARRLRQPQHPIGCLDLPL